MSTKLPKKQNPKHAKISVRVDEKALEKLKANDINISALVQSAILKASSMLVLVAMLMSPIAKAESWGYMISLESFKCREYASGKDTGFVQTIINQSTDPMYAKVLGYTAKDGTGYMAARFTDDKIAFLFLAQNKKACEDLAAKLSECKEDVPELGKTRQLCYLAKMNDTEKVYDSDKNI